MVQARSSAHDGALQALVRASADTAVAGPRLALGVLSMVLVVSLAIGWLTPGYEGDLNENKAWSRIIVRNGIHEAYRSNIDYAPVPLYVFGGVGWLYQNLVDPAWSESAARTSHTLTFMMKVPMILAHVGITGAIFALGSLSGNRLAAFAALAYGLNPSTLYNIAHLGHADALVGLSAVLCLFALHIRHGFLTGVGAGVLLLTKPQAWVLLPIVVLALLWRCSARQRVSALVAGTFTVVGLVSPWLVTGRAHHFWRYLENLDSHAVSNHVISADAHNLWWIPTLMHWDWIEDSAPMVGPITYRTAALILALSWLAFCVWSLRSRAHSVFLIGSAASFGFFMLMVRAHENHGYLAVTLLCGALALAPGRSLPRMLALASVGLLMNLVMRDPLIVGPFTSVPDPGQDAPSLLVGLQMLNVLINAVTLVLLGRLLWMRSSPLGTGH